MHRSSAPSAIGMNRNDMCHSRKGALPNRGFSHPVPLCFTFASEFAARLFGVRSNPTESKLTWPQDSDPASIGLGIRSTFQPELAQAQERHELTRAWSETGSEICLTFASGSDQVERPVRYPSVVTQGSTSVQFITLRMIYRNNNALHPIQVQRINLFSVRT